MSKSNLILITIDEVRPDRLSCYGKQKRIETTNFDQIASEGVLFEEAFSVSCLTPVVHATLLSGRLPHVHRVRDPYCFVEAPMLSHILKENGYKTAGYVGFGLLGALHGFNVGFDTFDEPTIHSATQKESYSQVFGVTYTDRQKEKGKNDFIDWEGLEREEEMIMWGGDWIPKVLDWIRENKENPFFLFTHYYKTHEGGERDMLASGEIVEGIMPEFSYYDAKVKRMDEYVLGSLFNELKRLDIYDNTTIVIQSDHGTNLGEHPAPKRLCTDQLYPQHTSMYDHDLQIAWAMKGKGLPGGRRVKGLVRNLDFVQTIIELFGLNTSLSLDGVSLLPAIEKGVSQGLTAYCEEIHESRGEGILQAMRTDKYKFIRNSTKKTEEFYNLIEDPEEKINLVGEMTAEEKDMTDEMRKTMEEYFTSKESSLEITDEQRERIDARLRVLGYIHDEE
jgi:arylsulfatase A-like enzyme